MLGFKGERGYSAYEIAVQNGFIGSEKDWLAQLGTSNAYSQDSTIYTTTQANQTLFQLPESYTSNAIMSIYVDGVKINENDYTIDAIEHTITLTKPVAEVGSKVEIVTTTMAVTELPIVSEVNTSSTDNTAPSAKCLYLINKDLTEKIEEVEEKTIPAGGEEGQVLSRNENGEASWVDLDLLNKIYPVGSIYMSANSVNPSELFGGTWEQIKDKFLLSAGSTYVAGNTGGEATHTLTTSEMPKHKHEAFDYMISASSTGGGYNVPTTTPATPTNLGTNEAGGGVAHNNMPPYLVVYIWKRTA